MGLLVWLVPLPLRDVIHRHRQLTEIYLILYRLYCWNLFVFSLYPWFFSPFGSPFPSRSESFSLLWKFHDDCSNERFLFSFSFFLYLAPFVCLFLSPSVLHFILRPGVRKLKLNLRPNRGRGWVVGGLTSWIAGEAVWRCSCDDKTVCWVRGRRSVREGLAGRGRCVELLALDYN